MNPKEINNRGVKCYKKQSHFSRKIEKPIQHFMEPFLSSKMKVGKFTSPLSNKSWKEYKIEVVKKKRQNNLTFKTQPSDAGNENSNGGFDIDKESYKGTSLYIRENASMMKEASFQEADIDPNEIFRDDGDIRTYKNMVLTPKTISRIVEITKEMVESPKKTRTRAKTRNTKKDSGMKEKKKNTKSRKKFLFGGRDNPRRSNSEKRRVTIDTSNLKVSRKGANH